MQEVEKNNGQINKSSKQQLQKAICVLLRPNCARVTHTPCGAEFKVSTNML